MVVVVDAAGSQAMCAGQDMLSLYTREGGPVHALGLSGGAGGAEQVWNVKL